MHTYIHKGVYIYTLSAKEVTSLMPKRAHTKQSKMYGHMDPWVQYPKVPIFPQTTETQIGDQRPVRS